MGPGSGGSQRLVRHAAFPSAYVEPRHVDVLLPSRYDADADGRYPVLYMHDGQNLFDRETAFAAEHWGVAEITEAMAAERRIRSAIVVGIWNSEHRGREYLPKVAASGSPAPEDGDASNPLFEDNAVADGYLRFCVSELKPFIDWHYRTLGDAANTFLIGSSRGALISLYAVCEYPSLFGGAACLSTHWPAAGGVSVQYFETRLPRPGKHRFYFDYGSETLDSLYGPYQKRMDEIMAAAGFRHGIDWVTRFYPNADHSEQSWRARLDVPLEFLLCDGENRQ